jgi:DNA-binding MarR family transcriptional regulator
MKRVFRSIINIEDPRRKQEPSILLGNLQSNYAAFVASELLFSDPAYKMLADQIADHFAIYKELPSYTFLYEKAEHEGNEGIRENLRDLIREVPYTQGNFLALLQEIKKEQERDKFQHLIQKTWEAGRDDISQGIEYFKENAKNISGKKVDVASILARTYSVGANENTLTKEGALPNDAIIILAAYQNSLKSTLAIDIAYRASLGEDILDQYEPRRPLKTLYICKDMTPRQIASYCTGLGYITTTASADWNLAVNENLRFLCPHCVPELSDLNFDTRKGMQLVERITDYYQPDLLILDALFNCVQGKINDENMRLFYNQMREKVSSRKICTLVLHHLRKQSKEEKSSGARSNIHDVYGSVVISASADAVLMTHKKATADESQRQVSITLEKPRDVFPNFFPLTFTSSQNTSYNYELDIPTARLVFELSYGRDETISFDADTDAETYYLLKCIAVKKDNAAIASDLKKSTRTVLRKIEHLKDKGLIVIRGEKRWTTYELTELGRRLLTKLPSPPANVEKNPEADRDRALELVLSQM